MPGINCITTVAFNGERYAQIDLSQALYQFDYGQVLYFPDATLPPVFEAHFSNDPIGQSKMQIGTGGYVKIPDSMLRSGAPIYCYIYLHDDDNDGRTEYRVDIPVVRRSARTFERISTQDTSVITEVVNAFNDGMARIAAIETEVTNQRVAAETARAYAEDAKAKAVAAANTVNGFTESIEDGSTGSLLAVTGEDEMGWVTPATDYNGDNSRPVTASFLYSEIQRLTGMIEQLITENSLSYTPSNEEP